MINARIYRSNEGLITSFTLSGHAAFDEYGKDIVCAGASAVTFGAVNAVLSLTNIEPQIDQGEKEDFYKLNFLQISTDL